MNLLRAPRRVSLVTFLLLTIAVTCCHSFSTPHLQPQQWHQKLSSWTPTQLCGSYFDEEDEEDREFARIRSGRKSRTLEKEEMMEELDDVVDDYFNNNNNDNDYQGIIPNALLDNIDPEGSAERVGELFTDKQFWIDIGLLLLFLNFLDNLRDPTVFDAIDMATM